MESRAGRPVKHILVTTDLTDESTAAFPVALQLAEAFDAEITMLTVLEDPAQAAVMPTIDVPLLPSIDLAPQLREKAEQEIQRLALRHFAGRTCSCWVEEGRAPVAVEIVDFAAARGADMIVMCTHGRRGLSHMLIGSITEKVMQNAAVPVVAVPLKGRG